MIDEVSVTRIGICRVILGGLRRGAGMGITCQGGAGTKEGGIEWQS